jgi:3-hydroxyisobutyrate dehydrogenase-like beta-hydroxyacid dehydrogenase
MTQPAIGLLHPGEMGAAVGKALRDRGHTVLWASTSRSAETVARAEQAGLEDVGTVMELSRASTVVLSICPPHAALGVARSVGWFEGLYIDANAVSPSTAREIATLVSRFVDGGIVGPPPVEAGSTRLYLSGSSADEAAALFAGTTLEPRVVSADPGAASAVKMAYAAWTKGTAAMLLSIRALARAEHVESALLDEWQLSQRELLDRSASAARSAGRKGWRWVAEMEEIASTFASVGLPDGFHLAAAEVFRRAPHLESTDAALDEVLEALTGDETRA